MSRHYEGRRPADRSDPGAIVEIVTGGERRGLPKRLDLYNHSPDGFEWGYGGSGPAQLALAILADHLREHPEDKPEACMAAGLPVDSAPSADELAVSLHQAYKFAVVAKLPGKGGWRLDAYDVHRALVALATATRTRKLEAADGKA